MLWGYSLQLSQTLQSAPPSLGGWWWRYLVEEEGPARGSGEAGGDELRPVGERRVTVGAAEEPRPADVVQEDAAHLLRLRLLPPCVKSTAPSLRQPSGNRRPSVE